MVVGKPDFNMNSYGIKYFVKGDDLENDSEQSTDHMQDKVNIPTLKPASVNDSIGGTSPAKISGKRVGGTSNIQSTAKVPEKISASTSATIDRVRAERGTTRKRNASGVPLKETEHAKKLEPEGKHTKDTKYYYDKDRKVNTYLGETEKPNDTYVAPIAGGTKVVNAPEGVPQGKSRRQEAKDKLTDAGKEKLGNRSASRYADEGKIPSSGKGAKEEFDNRSGTGGKDSDGNIKLKPVSEHSSDTKVPRALRRDVKTIHKEPNISDEDKQELTGGQKRVTVNDDKKGTKGNANELYEKIHGHKYGEKPEETTEEKVTNFKRQLRGELSVQAQQRSDTKAAEQKKLSEQKYNKEQGQHGSDSETEERANAADTETDSETSSRAHTGDYKQHIKPVDDTNQGYRTTFDSEEAKEIAHKKVTDKKTEEEDKTNPKDKKRREAILGHTGDKKVDSTTSSTSPKDPPKSNVVIEQTEDKKNEELGTTIPATQTKDEATTNVRASKKLQDIADQKAAEKKLKESEKEDLPTDATGTGKGDFTMTKQQIADAKAGKGKSKPKAKPKATTPNLSDEQMKKLMDDKAKRDSKTKAMDIIMDMAIMKLDLMKDIKDGKGSDMPKKGAKQLPQEFIGQTMDAKNGKMTKEKPLTEYDNYDNKHGLTARTERHRGNTLRHKKRDVKYGSSMDTQGMTPPAGSSLMDRDDAEVPKGKKSPNDLGKSAAETVFKAITLKLDLM